MLLEMKNVTVSFRKAHQRKLFGRERQTVLHGIDLSLAEGECLGIIGESGSGKSTLGKIASGLLPPDSGEVLLDGNRLYAPGTSAVNCWRKTDTAACGHPLAVVFQDYTTSVNPRWTVRGILGEAFRALRKSGVPLTPAEEARRGAALLERVGLTAGHLSRYPHELSGGQLQRVCIARAVALEPKMLLLDEAISSLDAATQIQVMDLLKDLREERGLSYLFITHDLTAITYLCDRVRFMHNGRFVEGVDDMRRIGQVTTPYARDLLDAVTGIGITHPAGKADLRQAQLSASRSGSYGDI